MYSVSETAEKTGVARSTLLYYERLGIIKPSRNPRNGYRQYSNEDLGRLTLLRQLKRAGLTLKESRRCIDGELDPSLIEKRMLHLDREVREMQMAREVLHTLFARATGGLMKTEGNGKMVNQWHADFEKHSADSHSRWLRQLGFSEKDALYIRWASRNMVDNTEYMKDFFKVFENMKRQGPGSDAATSRAFESLPKTESIKSIMEIGCGKGLTALLLADKSKAAITAVDNHGPFLDHLAGEIRKQGYENRITPTCASMFELTYPDGSFDLLWSEGSAYFMGFERALKEWRRLLRKDGFLFISDAVWLTDRPSPECAEYWKIEYPDMTTPAARKRQAVAKGYDIVTDFILPRNDWIAFYRDMRAQLDLAVRRWGAGRAFGDMEREIQIDNRHGDEYGCVCLLLQKQG